MTYPPVKQLDIRLREAEERHAAYEASRIARAEALVACTRPRWFARLARSVRPWRSAPSVQIGPISGLPPRERDALARLAGTLAARAGQRLVLEGQDPASFFVIAEGHAAVIRGRKRVAELGPGDFFGELALLEKSQRTATVVATTDVSLRVLDQSEFATAMRNLPAFEHLLRDARRARLQAAAA